MYVSVNYVIIGSGDGWSPDVAKPLPVSMLTYCQLDHKEQISVKS